MKNCTFLKDEWEKGDIYFISDKLARRKNHLKIRQAIKSEKKSNQKELTNSMLWIG